MGLKRMFSTYSVRGASDYLDTQKKYEILRTVLYFAISISLFVAGYIHTGRKTNLLTIVAVLGCLPAAKSAVSAIMFLQFHSCNPLVVRRIEPHCKELGFMFDCVFTSYKRNYVVNHIAIRANTICGYSEKKDFPEKEFYEHLDGLLRKDGHKDVSIKIFTNLNKYVERLDQMNKLEENLEKTAALLITIDNIIL